MKAGKIMLVVLAGLGVCASIQCNCPFGCGRTSLDDNKDVIRRQVDDVWNKGNLAALDELMAADLVGHGMPPGIAPGRDGFKQLISGHRKAFPDLQVKIEDMLAEGDKVANRWTWSGTHNGEYLGIAPTGKKVTMTGISIHRFEDGKIAEQWHEVNMLGLMQQFGIVKAPPPKK